MKVLAVGGGSGGHVTPVVAVLKELRKSDPSIELQFWCDKKFGPQAASIIHRFDSSIPVKTIFSGKLRRYHNLALWRQFLRPASIVGPNLRDSFFVLCGFLQSLIALQQWKPDVVFTKGGFVCLPVGMAARVLHIPLVIHDSDAHPGLTNRILARWATTIATGAPLEYYHYPHSISHYVGIPVSEECVPFSKQKKADVRAKFGLALDRPLVVVTGGGLGARRINDAIATTIDYLLEEASVVLISGAAQYDELRVVTPIADTRFQLLSFVSEGMIDLLGAADIVVARAGATTILELAGLAQTTIIVPNGFLTGGHQLKNARVYEDAGAVSVVNDIELEKDPTILSDRIIALLHDDVQRKQLGSSLHAFARPQAAHDMAELVLNAVK